MRMESIQQWWRARLSFRNATIVVCFFNLITVLFLLQSFFFASSNRKFATNQPNSVQLRYIKESEEIRRAMEPLELIKRVREIRARIICRTSASPTKRYKADCCRGPNVKVKQFSFQFRCRQPERWVNSLYICWLPLHTLFHSTLCSRTHMHTHTLPLDLFRKHDKSADVWFLFGSLESIHS
ncbi:hypothetical protein F0562_000578 [Nyssa sinensis]|uniref:Uncharacterized protein n=1 Tax=Nyssa sinensis TaxID=561372 RepID=A0A5J5C220_9ASTE|nr:hypothetical protein F0562_000578 [Nyssa sinensis]